MKAVTSQRCHKSSIQACSNPRSEPLTSPVREKEGRYPPRPQHHRRGLTCAFHVHFLFPTRVSWYNLEMPPFPQERQLFYQSPTQQAPYGKVTLSRSHAIDRAILKVNVWLFSERSSHCVFLDARFNCQSCVAVDKASLGLMPRGWSDLKL